MTIKELYEKNKGNSINIKHYGVDVNIIICGYATIIREHYLIAAVSCKCVAWKTINKDHDVIDAEYLNNEYGYIYLSLKQLEALTDNNNVLLTGKFTYVLEYQI